MEEQTQPELSCCVPARDSRASGSTAEGRERSGTGEGEKLHSKRGEIKGKIKLVKVSASRFLAFEPT